MNFVQPIRSSKKIAQMKNFLRSQNRYRDLLLFVVGINTALRISDLLPLRVGDFIDAESRFRDRFWRREEKRGKHQEVILNDSIRQALDEYLAAYPAIENNPKHFVFFNTRTHDYSKPITRKQAWRVISTICPRGGVAWQLWNPQPAQNLGLPCPKTWR
jgi:integrase